MANSERIEAIIVMLAERFPNCFTSGGSPRPLKVGIHEDLMAAGLEFSKTELRRAIGHYCSREVPLRLIVG
jgi:sRNA-binding protein